jgi:hypothetical protein
MLKARCVSQVKLLKDGQRRTTSVQWPTEVDDRLNLLVRIVVAEGIPISRAQMLSALVADAALNGPRLARVARRYLGRLKAGDLDSSTPANVELPSVRYRGRKPAPDRRRKSLSPLHG